jgi:hypothetical protein
MSTRIDVDFVYTEDWTFAFTVEDGDGTPIDITGSQLRFRLADLDGTVLMTRAEGDGFIVTSGTDGECMLRITPTNQTDAGVIPSSRYLWEFRCITSGNLVLTQANGHLVVQPSLFA